MPPKFKAGDFIIWDRILWLVVKVDDETYELKLVDPKQFTTKHGNGGYMDIDLIDQNAQLVKNGLKVGGSRRSRKNSRSKSRRRSSNRRR